MTDEEINRAIVEEIEWKPQTLDTDYNGVPWPDYPPDYCKDLNAIHAEMNRAFGQTTMWESFVRNILSNQPEVGVLDSLVVVARATARQTAEAFLNTLREFKHETK